MVAFYPGPQEVEIFYVEGGITHKQRLNCTIAAFGNVGDPFSAFSVQQRGAAVQALNAAVDAYIALLRPLLATTTNLTIANLYSYAPNSYDKTFQATYDINLLGTNAGAFQINHQTFLTFTTQLGNNMKWTLLDDVSSNQLVIPIRDAPATYQSLANYLIGATGWINARDGSYPTGKLNYVGGQNEALFNRRNR